MMGPAMIYQKSFKILVFTLTSSIRFPELVNVFLTPSYYLLYARLIFFMIAYGYAMGIIRRLPIAKKIINRRLKGK